MPFHKKFIKILYAPFKLIGNVLSYIGKKINKGFQKLGKFMNKFGILGQIGMMWITGGISNAMFAGLRSLGSGFMQGLSAGGGMSKTAHSILQGVSKLAKIPGNLIVSTAKETYGTITDAVVGTVQDTYNFLDNTLALGKLPGDLGYNKGSKGWFDSIGDRLSQRFGEATRGIAKSTGEAVEDAKKFYGDVFEEGSWKPRNPEADYRKYRVPTGRQKEVLYGSGEPVLDPETGNPKTYPEMKEVVRDIKYSSENLRDFEEYAQTYLDPKEFPTLSTELNPAPVGDPYFMETAPEGGARIDPVPIPHRLRGSRKSGADFMEAAPERRASILEAEADTNYYGHTEQDFKRMTKQLPEDSLLWRAGATFTDELKDWFTSPGTYFQSAATAMGGRLLQPSPMPKLHARVPGSPSTARSRSAELTAVYNAMSQRKSREGGYQLPLDDLDPMYTGLEEYSLAEGDTGGAFDNPYPPTGFGRVA